MTASTPGEDRWSDTGNKPLDDGLGIIMIIIGLLPGHAYSLLQVKEYQNNKLVCLRNPWGQFEWQGDWSDKSNLWTEEAKAALKPNL